MHLALLLTLLAWQPPQVHDITIPVTNQPANFSGAAGAYRIEVHADPAVVRVEDPITLTVKIVSLQAGPWQHPPRRERLQVLPAEMANNFFVEPVLERDRFLPGENAWEFVWVLMPKHQLVKSIPLLEFVYYHTTATPGFKAAEGARSIAIEVQPRPSLLVTAPSGARERFQQIARGTTLLTMSAPASQRLAVTISAAVVPPVLCFSFHFLWRQWFPDAVERLRRRRVRALRTALQLLHKLNRSATPAQVRAVIAEYLCLHLDLPPGGPTPADVKSALLRRGLRQETAQRAESFVRRCDAALFAPVPETRSLELTVGAEQLLRQMEAAFAEASKR